MKLISPHLYPSARGERIFYIKENFYLNEKVMIKSKINQVQTGPLPNVDTKFNEYAVAILNFADTLLFGRVT